MSMTLEESIQFHTEEAEKMKLHKKVNEIILGTEAYERELKEHTQTAEWLEELRKRREADSCEGCKNISLWENEYENGVSCPCSRCARRAEDNYEPERRTDAVD